MLLWWGGHGLWCDAPLCNGYCLIQRFPENILASVFREGAVQLAAIEELEG
jgi:hypothetical protein